MSATELIPARHATPANPEWHRIRRGGISASEIAGVLGISPWDSAFSLYWRKVEGWDTQATEDMSTGTILEAGIADLWADRCDPHENLVIVRAGLYASDERPWQLATPDRLIHPACPCCDGRGGCDSGCSGVPGACSDCRNTGLGGPADEVLECKWTGTWDGWGDVGSDDIPPHYRAQVLQQCDVLGIGEWSLAVLGPSGFRHYHGVYDRAARRDIILMRRAGEAFVQRLVDLDPPPVDDGHPATIAALRRIHPSMTDTEIEVDATFADGWRRARALRSRAEALCDRYEARARDQLGAGHRLTNGGTLVASRSIYERKPYEVGPATIDKLNPGKAIR